MAAQRKIDTTVGDWSWSHENFATKYTVDPQTDCWVWNGAYHPAGALFGAYKRGTNQMTQARRLAYMHLHNESIDGTFIKSTCRNLQCVNPTHHYIHKLPIC